MNIAMWSGPRNLSTAMMYSFAARGDCTVWDEPFYAAYLKATGADHPMRAQILAAHPSDPALVARRCAAPAATPLFYQKHMTHHMVPGIDRSWFGAVTHVFLIRHPARVIASYHAKNENPALADIGFVQQTELFAQVQADTGAPPVVIDSADIRRDPRRALQALCDALGIAFTDGMLRWPAGARPEDGVWGDHWYDAVRRSTGFAAAEGAVPRVPDHLRAVFEAALPHYRMLSARALAV